MIKSTIFTITLDNGRKAFNSAIIERNGYHTIIIDKNIKRYETYQNLFLRIVQGVYKIDFLKKKKSQDRREIYTSTIKNKNIFDNLTEYSNLNQPYDVSSTIFDLTPIHLNKNTDFYNAFGESKNFLILDFKKDINLLNENFELISDMFTYDKSISDFLKKIVEEDYSIATLEVESENRIDFDNLSIGLLDILSTLKSNIKQLLGKSILNDRVALSLSNKCIQTKFFIPKSEELSIQSEITKENLDEIQSSNIIINETDKLSTSMVVNNIFRNKEIDTLKFVFQDDISVNDTIEVNLQNTDFILKDLKKEINDFKNKSDLNITDGKFLINEVKGIFDGRRTEFIFIKKDTEEKYKLIFINNKLTDGERTIKAKLLLLPVKSEIRAKLKYKKRPSLLVIEEFEFLN